MPPSTDRIGARPQPGGDRKSVEYKEENQSVAATVCFSEDTAQDVGLSAKQGGDRKSPEYKGKNQGATVASCFPEDTAQKIGLTQRSIRPLPPKQRVLRV